MRSRGASKSNSVNLPEDIAHARKHLSYHRKFIEQLRSENPTIIHKVLEAKDIEKGIYTVSQSSLVELYECPSKSVSPVVTGGNSRNKKSREEKND